MRPLFFYCQLVVKACISHRRDLHPPPADGHDTTGQYTPANHGVNGMLPVTLPGSSQLFDSQVIATAKDLSEQFLLNEYIGARDLLGVGHVH